MERKSLSTKNRKSKEKPLDGAPSTKSSNTKGILKDAVSNKSNLSVHRSPLSKSGSYLGILEKSHDQNESLGFHCSFETDGSAAEDIDIPCTQPVTQDKILEGVVAFIEVRSNTENRFEGISKQMEMLGAKVVKKLTPEVTHVIFKDGKKATRERALKKGIHLVSVLWVESCRQSGKRVSEDLFPVVVPEQAVTPLMVGRLKRTKSMQPKAFEEDVQNSAERGERRRKRKLQAENATPTAMVFAAETLDPHSPIGFNPPITPHMIPDTPCHDLGTSPPFDKAFTYDVGKSGEKPKPIKFSEEENEESPDSSDDIPSSISKLKRRLLKCTPTRPPSVTLTEPRMTPVTQLQKTCTPRDVLLTGSDQGKKRKRQDSTKESQSEDIKVNGAKERKKVKLGEQVESDAKNVKGKRSKTASTGRNEQKNESTDGKAHNLYQNSGVCLKPAESSSESTSEGKKHAGILGKKKGQAKANKKIVECRTNDGEDLDSDSGVSIVDGNMKGSITNGEQPSRKKFSKTSKIVCQTGVTEAELEDVSERKLVENMAKIEPGGTKKEQNLNKGTKKGNGKKLFKPEKLVSQDKQVVRKKVASEEKLVNGGKPVGEESLLRQANDCEEGKDGQDREKAMNGSLVEDEDVENDETGAEEEEQPGEEKENKSGKKQRNKLMKKVKPKRSIVMTSMHFGEQDIVLSVVRKLGSFFIEDRVSSSTTHVIAGSPRRTLNVLMAIAQGCWLVSPMWIMKSLEVGYWVDEEPYELSDAFPAAQLCRLERVSAGSSYRQELFAECPPIFLSENCSPPSDSLINLINLCGGKVSTSVRKAGICIGSMTRRTQAVNITEQWLLDCITEHTVLPYANYALNSPAKRQRETSPSY